MEVPENIRNIKFRGVVWLRRMMVWDEDDVPSRQQNAAFTASNCCFGDVKAAV